MNSESNTTQKTIDVEGCNAILPVSSADATSVIRRLGRRAAMSLTSAVRVSGGVARRLGAIGSRASAFIPSQCPLMTSATRESSSDDVFITNDRQIYNAAEALCSWNRNTCFRRKLIYVLAFNYDMHMLCLKNSDGNGLRTQNDSIQTFIHI